MAKQGGGIARITSFFGVAEYEGAHEHQGNSEAEGAATSAQPEESSARLNVLPTPLDGGHKRRYARQESSAAADRGYDNSADNHWEDDTVQDNAEVEYTQDQYGYEDGELAEEYPRTTVLTITPVRKKRTNCAASLLFTPDPIMTPRLLVRHSARISPSL